MEPKTLELLRLLQAGIHDAQTFDMIRALLATQRSRLAEADDRATLADLSELLEVWAEGAPPTMAAAALIEAAQIAEQHLEQSERAVQLYLDSIEHEPGDLSALHKIEELLSRQKDSDRLENVLAQQAAALRIRDDFEPVLAADVYRRLARLRSARGDQSAAIEAYEQALDVSPDAGVIRDLADAYAKRGGDADRTQAADLYCTLGDVLGAPDGAEWLERALDQAPGHDAALDLLESFIPPEQHADRLIPRWQAYVERSDDEASVDKRRMLLARAHAARGAAREALICLGPLIERSDAPALELQAECLASLRAEEQRGSAPGGKRSAAGKPIKPATLVGFRVPPKDPQPFESAEASDPVSETRARPGAEPAQPAPQPKPAQEAAPAAAKPSAPIVAQPVARATPAAAKPAAEPVATKQAAQSAKGAAPAAKEAAPPIKRRPRPQSGETLVGFHLPPELAGDRPSDAEAEAEAALEEAAAELAAAKAAGDDAERVESSRVVLRANAPAQQVPSARASGAGEARPATARSGSATAAPSRAHARTLMGVAPSGPAAAAAALKAAAASRQPSTPPAARASSAPPGVVSAAAKAAELRAAALRATVPAGLVSTDAPQARASAPAAAPAKISSRPPYRGRTNGAPAAAAIPAALAPTLPLEQMADDTAVAAPAAPVVEQAEPAPAQSLPMASQSSAFADSPFLSAATGPASSRRWWIASAVALAVLGGVIALIARPTSKVPPPPLPTRVESAPPQPALAPIAAAVPSTTATAVPTTSPVPENTAAAAPTTPTPQPAAAPPPARRAQRHADPEVKAIAKQLKIKGAGLSNKDVLGALDDAIDKIETCYGRILDKNPRAEGDVTVGFTVDKSGKATHVKKVSATLKEAAAQKCATEAIGKTRFPKPDKKKPVSVTASLSFKKG